MALLFLDLNFNISVRRARSRFASISAGVQYLVLASLVALKYINSINKIHFKMT